MLLQDHINEFELASILDTYSRTLPKSIHSFSINNKPVVSKYGLTLYPSGNLNDFKPDEVHVLIPKSITLADQALFKNGRTINYCYENDQYTLNHCLVRIDKVLGRNFMNFVKLTLDYN